MRVGWLTERSHIIKMDWSWLILFPSFLVACINIHADGWRCSECGFVNTFKTNACKVGSSVRDGLGWSVVMMHVPFPILPCCSPLNPSRYKVCGSRGVARSLKGGSGGPRSEAAAIAREYKKRRRVQPKVAKAAALSPTPDSPDDGSDSFLGAKVEVENEDADASSGAAAPTAVVSVRARQSEVFGQQLKAMHCLLLDLGRLRDFRACFPS